MSRRTAGLIAVAVAALLAVGIVVGQNRLSPAQAAVESQELPADTTAVETTDVTERDLTESVELFGVVDHGEPKTLNIRGEGIVTSAPKRGDVLEPGDELLRVADKPITLAQGDVPLFRSLRLVNRWEEDAAGDRLGKQTGADVEQLQRFLIDRGFDDEGRLEVDGIFGISTQRAVKAWQRDVGHPATGQVDGQQLLFVNGPVRIDAAPEVGDTFSEVRVSDVRPTVTVEISSRQRAFFTIGTEVSIEADDGVHAGRVASVERITSGDGSTRHKVTIEFADSTPDTETAKIVSTRSIATAAPSVPVRALVALAEGGWALQVQTDDGIKLTGVRLGEIVDGIAEIRGVPVGTTVVIPA